MAELTPGEKELIRRAHSEGFPGEPFSPGTNRPARGARRNWQAPEKGRDVIPRTTVNAGNDSSGNPVRKNMWINGGLDG
jgi:hypothetical protein